MKGSLALQAHNGQGLRDACLTNLLCTNNIPITYIFSHPIQKSINLVVSYRLLYLMCMGHISIMISSRLHVRNLGIFACSVCLVSQRGLEKEEA